MKYSYNRVTARSIVIASAVLILPPTTKFASVDTVNSWEDLLEHLFKYNMSELNVPQMPGRSRF